MQESASNDVERTFGMLQARWGIVRGAAMMWDPKTLRQATIYCVILHNIIVENERDEASQTNGIEKPGEHARLPE